MMGWFIKYWMMELALDVMFENIERNLCLGSYTPTALQVDVSGIGIGESISFRLRGSDRLYEGIVTTVYNDDSMTVFSLYDGRSEYMRVRYADITWIEIFDVDLCEEYLDEYDEYDEYEEIDDE